MSTELMVGAKGLFIVVIISIAKTAKSLRDFIRKAKKPADMILYDFKT
jgi:hypothetical protein